MSKARNFTVYAGTAGLALIMVAIVLWRTGQTVEKGYNTETPSVEITYSSPPVTVFQLQKLIELNNLKSPFDE